MLFHHTLPLKHITKVILVVMLMKCVLWINLFKPRVVVSTSVSPHIILIEVKFDYNKNYQLQFGKYAQLHPDNTLTIIQADSMVGDLCS